MEDESPEVPIINIGRYDGPRNELGERHGRGRSEYPNKDVYVGNFESGLRSGQGTYRFAYLGVKYHGAYQNGLRNGRGTMRYANGTVYEGEFVNSVREGYGRIEYPNLDYYEGEWLKGLPHGKGKYYYRSCDSISTGTFEFGRIIQGELTLRDGSKWIGGFRLNQPFGEGKWVNGNWEQQGEFIEINPIIKEEEEIENENENENEEDIEKSIEDEMAEDQEKLDQKKEGEEGEEEKEPEEEGAEKPDPREKTLRSLLPPKRVRKTIKYEIGKIEDMKSIKLRWVPVELPRHVGVQ